MWLEVGVPPGEVGMSARGRLWGAIVFRGL